MVLESIGIIDIEVFWIWSLLSLVIAVLEREKP